MTHTHTHTHTHKLNPETAPQVEIFKVWLHRGHLMERQHRRGQQEKNLWKMHLGDSLLVFINYI